MPRLYFFFGITLVLLACNSSSDTQYSHQDWGGYLGDKHRSHYSTLTRITPSNVQNLEKAWEYHSGDADTAGRSQIQCNPLIIQGVLYGSSPNLRFFALDASTGTELWSFTPSDETHHIWGAGVNRGLIYWEEAEDRRILCTAGSWLFALDAKTGKPIRSFGDNGAVDLKQDLGRDVKDLFVVSNTPGVIYKDLLILGTRVPESNPSVPGHIRAYHVKTGKLAWIFHTIPHPGEEGYETWPEDAWKRAGGANSWSGMSLDEKRGVVYIPTGSAAFDFYGGDRTGQNLYANCILALDAATGKRIWHFQTIHHDIWDRDLPAPPNLVTVRHKGKKIDAVAQITKSGFVFLLNRDTGEPLFPIEEKAVPGSELLGEEAWSTQPVPVQPPPFARQAFNLEDALDFDSLEKSKIQTYLSTLKTGNPYNPPSEEGTVIFPGLDGGGEWGGAAVDPRSAMLYVNANEMPWVITMIRLREQSANSKMERGRYLYTRSCISCHGKDKKGGTFMGNVPALIQLKPKYTEAQLRTLIQQGKGAMPSYAYLPDDDIQSLIAFISDDKQSVEIQENGTAEEDSIQYGITGYKKFKSGNYPAIRPPWGTLSAIDLNKGEINWQIPLGEYPELKAKGIPVTGTENYGGPVLTASGLLFIGATLDAKLRAFDAKTGKMLWETQLPAAGFATPATYEVNGEQYIVIACGGGKLDVDSGDAYVAYKLKR